MRHFGGILLLVCGCVAPPAGELQQAVGEVKNGFPNPWERALLMAANRARSDPATVKGPASAMYPAHAPLVIDFDLSRSARFHATTLEMGQAPLMHPSPCVLKSDVGTSGCDGAPACACTTGVTCNSCDKCADGTDPFTRIGYFFHGFPAGEIAAAGYGDPWRTMDGWVDEAAGADGHRQIVDSGAGLVGFGHAEGAAGACWAAFDVGDFGSDTPAPARIASAAPNPIGGSAGSYQIYASWNDPKGGAPRSLSAVVDGKCVAMSKELGDEKLNATFLTTVPLGAGCHAVYVLGADSSGARATYPTTTAFTIQVGSAACADEVAQPAPDCDPTFVPTAPPDLGAAHASDLALRGDPTTPPSAPQPPAPSQPSPEPVVIENGCSAAPGLPIDGAWIVLMLLLIRRKMLTRSVDGI